MQAADFVGEQPCIVHVADGLLAQPLAPLTKLLREGAPDLVTLVRRLPGESGSVGLTTRRLLALAGAAPAERSIELTGVRLFGAGALSRAGGIGWWPGRELELVSLAEQLIDEGGRLHVEQARNWRRYCGETRELLELNHFMLDALVCEPQPAPDAESRIEGCVAIDSAASVRSSVIVGPAIIGAGASVIESYIGPYTSIGANALIEGAEVERSIILPDASIMHVGGRLTSSLVGRHARVFRDFSLPRALRLNVGDSSEVALC
jgi:glucose-1-phosphate thymidylyltransferase